MAAITRYGTSGYGIRKTGSFASKTATEAKVTDYRLFALRKIRR